jgi:50S ribosomal protein L16 3-hydroxylase
MSDAGRAPLGEQTVSRFLARHWQKQALLIRDAIPGFAGLFDAKALIELATRDDVESRLIVHERGRYSLEHGPFARAAFRALPKRGWTLLVQGLNLHSDAADALMRRFSFIPYARLDDVMASYAVDGGGVGPHFDSYDVFLLQGPGRRRWRYGRQRDLSLVPDMPVKLLRRFTPTHDAVLAAGDMLYLPPHYAHDGVAIEACTTYSIGFRAPAAQELASAFLDFVGDELAIDGRYADPDLSATREPARIAASMQRRFASMLAQLHWDRTTIARFLGSYLSEPKPHVAFDPPARASTRSAFARRIVAHGVVLDRRSQLLYDDARFYLNGEAIAVARAGRAALRTLANSRRLSAQHCASLDDATLVILFDAYRHGFLAPAR